MNKIPFRIMGRHTVKDTTINLQFFTVPTGYVIYIESFNVYSDSTGGETWRLVITRDEVEHYVGSCYQTAQIYNRGVEVNAIAFENEIIGIYANLQTAADILHISIVGYAFMPEEGMNIALPS